MKIDPISAQANASGRKVPSPTASEVPTSTGATAAGSVRGRAATSQSFRGLKGEARSGRAQPGLGRSRSAGELVEFGAALLAVGVAPFLRLLGSVEEKVRVVCQLLDAGEAVLVGVEARLDQPQGEGGEGEHVAAPLHRLLLELLERHDGVDQTHLVGPLRVVLAAEHPDLLGALLADLPGEHGCSEAAVPGADAWARLAKARVVGGD